jgi:hypothetical protein
MSYSFAVVAATKDAAIAAIAAKFDEMMASQPVHARDREAVLANSSAVIGLLDDQDDKDIAVSCNGYLSWSNGVDPAAIRIGSAAVNCVANYVQRTQIAPA